MAVKDGDKLVVERLITDFGLNQRQALFVIHFVRTGNQRKAYELAGYSGDEESRSSNASRLIHKDNVVQAHLSLLHELYPERAADFRLSKQKVLEDLEGIKSLAVQNIKEGKSTGGSYNAAVRASELQGRELGMFAQKHHHAHEHALISDEMLLKKLAEDDPVLARTMADHLGVVVDAEFEVVEDETD